MYWDERTKAERGKAEPPRNGGGSAKGRVSETTKGERGMSATAEG